MPGGRPPACQAGARHALVAVALLVVFAASGARAQATVGESLAPADEPAVQAPQAQPSDDEPAAPDAEGDASEDAWAAFRPRAAHLDAPLEELSRLMGSATKTIETTHRRFESRLGAMSSERILSAVRGATLANAIGLLLYAPLTAFVSLVSGRLGRFIHAAYAGIAGWSLLVAELPIRVRGQRGSVRFLSTQVGRASALLFASAAAWRSGPVGMLVSALTSLNALYNVYVTAVHPAFRDELAHLSEVCRGISAVTGQLRRALLRALNAATGGPDGASSQAGQGRDEGDGRPRHRGNR